MKIQANEIKIVSVKDLKLKKGNRNKHPKDQLEMLAKHFAYQGFRNPLIVSNQSGEVVCGNGRLMAAKKAGLKELPVIYQDFETPEMEYSYHVADNGLGLWSELDFSGINADIGDLGPDFDIDMLGLKNFSIDVADKEELCDADEVPEHVEPKAKLGDIYQLGSHRLMCGDSTSVQALGDLTAGQKIEMVFTDPPYGMNAVSKSGVLSKNYKKDILGDDNTDAAKDSFNLAISTYPDADHIWWGANYYSSTLPNAECWIVWDKNNGQSDQTDCELAWTNYRSVVRQYTAASEKTNRVHPTQKPVALFEWLLKRFKSDPKTVLDLFGGSGSTLIACEKTNRKCFMMELDPHYIDVIIARFEKYTGQTAQLINGDTNGKT